MKGIIDIHTHTPGHSNALLNYYRQFEQSAVVPFCSLGLHPWYPDEATFEQLAVFAEQENVLAIGECGLDKLCETDWSLQQELFLLQIELANRLNKPLIIHCVRAYNECIQVLTSAKVPVIFHGFNRSLSVAQMLLAKGFYLSIGAAIFNTAFEAVFAALPPERIFFETDDRADLAIESIYKRAAELQKIEVESLILQVEHNFQKVFSNAR